MYLNAAAKLAQTAVGGRSTGEASQICRRFRKRINIGPDRVSTLPSADYWIGKETNVNLAYLVPLC